MQPTDRPPLNLPALLAALHSGRVRWILTGSTVLAVYGADLTPNDIDVTPALDPENLSRLADVLAGMDATVAFDPSWANGPGLDECRAWSASPATEKNLDHLFVTTHGLVDVPPRLCGTYDDLIPSATVVEIADMPVTVCDPDVVLALLPGRTRAKDLARAQIYTDVRRKLAADRTPSGVDRLLARLS